MQKSFLLLTKTTVLLGKRVIIPHNKDAFAQMFAILMTRSL